MLGGIRDECPLFLFIFQPMAAILVEDFGDLTGTNGAATFADSEAKTLVAGYGVDKFDDNFYVVAGHYHFSTFGEGDFTGYVECTDVELGTVVVVERSVTAAFFFFEDIDRSLEFGVGLNDTGVADYHTAFNVFLVDTTEEKTYVVAGFALVEELAEHFNTGNGGFESCAKTHDLYFVTYFYDAGLDTAGGNSTTTCDGEDVFNRHKEGFVNVAGRQGNPVVDGFHELENFLFPLGLAIEGAES